MKLIIKNLTKTYPGSDKPALNGISLEIDRGMFGLLGPNGAGKSSLMRTLVTLQQADEGSVALGEIDVLKSPDEVRQHIGYLPQEFGVYPRITADVMLDHLACLKGIVDKAERKALVEELLLKTNLIEHRRKKLGAYSGGMKQRFGIAQALIGNPKLIVVDEPTAGLDPTERNRFHNLLAAIGSEAIVILSTHIVEDVKNLCTNMAILNRGEIKMISQPKEAIKSIDGQIWEKAVAPNELEALKRSNQVISERLFDGETMAKVYASEAPSPEFRKVKPDLEDVYFSILSQPETIRS